jgi:hypothetical protein
MQLSRHHHYHLYLGLSCSAIEKFSKDVEDYNICKINDNNTNSDNDNYDNGNKDDSINNTNNNNISQYNTNRKKMNISPNRSIFGTIRIKDPSQNNEMKIETTESLISPYTLRYDNKYQKIDRQISKNLNFLDFYLPESIQSYLIPIGLDGLSVIASCPHNKYPGYPSPGYLDLNSTINPNPHLDNNTNSSANLNRTRNSNPNLPTNPNAYPNAKSNSKLNPSYNGSEVCIGYIIPMINNLIKNKSSHRNISNTNMIYVSSLIIVNSYTNGNHIYDLLLALCYQTGIKPFFAVEECIGKVE